MVVLVLFIVGTTWIQRGLVRLGSVPTPEIQRLHSSFTDTFGAIENFRGILSLPGRWYQLVVLQLRFVLTIFD